MQPQGQPNDVSATGAVYAKGSGRIKGVVLTPAAAAATLVLHDNASAASGTVLARLQAPANGGSAVFVGLDIPFANGVYATLGGAGAAAVVYL